MSKLGLEKEEELEIKLPHSLDYRESKTSFSIIRCQKNKCQKNINLFFINYTKAFDCVDHYKLCKVLREMGISDHLTCLMRNLNVVQKTAVRTLCGKLTGSRLRKEYHTAVCGHPVCSTYMLKTSQKCWVG